MKKFGFVLLFGSLISAATVLGQADPACPNCIIDLNGSVAYQETKTYPFGVVEGVDYHCHLFSNAAMQLSVTGSLVSGLSCDSSGLTRVCNFTATGDGTVSCRVAGNPGPASFHLHADDI